MVPPRGEARDHAAIGSVTNLAARLVAAAEPWQVLTTDRVVHSLVRPVTAHEPLGEITPRGFAHAVRMSDIAGSEAGRRALGPAPQRPA